MAVEKRPHKPSMEELLNQISTKITRIRNGPLEIEQRPRVRVRSIKFSQRDKLAMLLCNSRSDQDWIF